MKRARALGFEYNHPEWANLGQVSALITITTTTDILPLLLLRRKTHHSWPDPLLQSSLQGAPETGELPGQPSRKWQVELDHVVNEYANEMGTKELRQAVANYYNEMYRKGT